MPAQHADPASHPRHRCHHSRRRLSICRARTTFSGLRVKPRHTAPAEAVLKAVLWRARSSFSKLTMVGATGSGLESMGDDIQSQRSRRLGRHQRPHAGL